MTVDNHSSVGDSKYKLPPVDMTDINEVYDKLARMDTMLRRRIRVSRMVKRQYEPTRVHIGTSSRTRENGLSY